MSSKSFTFTYIFIYTRAGRGRKPVSEKAHEYGNGDEVESALEPLPGMGKEKAKVGRV